MRAAKEASSALRGVLDGQELARVFAWMRPNDLIWNYWVNNYLLGNQPPAFDILFWNADTTRLPARLHHDYIDLYFTNPFVNANKLTLNGAAIDMKRVKADSYVVAGHHRSHHAVEGRSTGRPRSTATTSPSCCRAADTCRVCSTRRPIPRSSFVTGLARSGGRGCLPRRRREAERQLVAALARLAS